jgi:hypothetical protein
MITPKIRVQTVPGKNGAPRSPTTPGAEPSRPAAPGKTSRAEIQSFQPVVPGPAAAPVAAGIRLAEPS